MAQLSLRNASLSYPLMHDGALSMRAALAGALFPGRRLNSKVSHVNALNEINLELKDGDRLGLIGPNGAGKSTLLRLLAGIFVPTTGEVVREGSVVTMFDLSYGMDEEANGFDNITLAGTVLGLSFQEIRDIRNDVVSFSELGDALERPVKTFSAGMRVRLAFGLLSSLPSEILLIDEIIGVGDVRFMKKASSRIKTCSDSAKIFVLASHAESVLKDFCDTAVVMKEGTIHYFGPVDDAIAFYNGTDY